MKKQFCFSAVLALSVVTGLGFRSANPSHPPSHAVFTDITPHPYDPLKLLAVSEKEVYLREGNQSWRKLISLPGGSASFQKLIAHPNLPEKIFLLTEEGVIETNLKGTPPRWIFREANPEKNRVYSFAIHPDDPKRLYVGTERGLFRSPDGGKSWLEPFEWPENQPIEFVSFLTSPSSPLLLGTPRELFFAKDEEDPFESGFSLPLSSLEEEGLSEETGKEIEKPVHLPRFTSLAFSHKDLSRVWVGTSEGVFESRDGGVAWEKLPERGLEERRIRDLVFSDSLGQLLAATSRGVVRFHPTERRWERLPLGLIQSPPSLVLRSLPGNESEVLLVAAGGDLLEWKLESFEAPYRNPTLIPSPEHVELFQKWIRLEPSAQEIQKAAIRYADLGNGKIKRWHWASRMRAFIPDLSLGKDISFDPTIDIDRGGAATPDEFIRGPEEISKRWNFDVTWELGDLLWSSAQTSIDSRAKLLVELRESILSQVTRIYFERRRVQMEIALSGSPTNAQDYFDLLLRYEELTAQLDALTGGFLSRSLEKIKQIHPEGVKLFNGLSGDQA